MATAYTTRVSTDEVVIGGDMNMNSVTTVHLTMPMFQQDTMAGSLGPLPSPRINIPPPPNPPFTFPARPSSSAPSSLSRSTGRRHQSAIDIPKFGLGVEFPDSHSPSAVLPDFQFDPGNDLSPASSNRRRRPPPLPDFAFNPGADASFLSPSTASPSPRTIPHMGHRRGGSEFVGGKLKTGEPITVMSTSPTKSESGSGSPTLAPATGPRRHQRGHSHRRSGAISSHDLTLILQTSPNPSSRGSSAPTSPAGFRDPQPPLKPKEQQTAETTSTATKEVRGREHAIPEKPSQSLPDLSSKPPTRARVGFSDTLEFIPRPLSLVSTDTASTVRPGHSVSGSISSIASITNTTNADRDSPIVLGASAAPAKSTSRPSTAGAVLERTSSLHVAAEDNPSPKRRNSMLILNDLAQANPATPALSTPTKTPKRWSFFGFDSFAPTGSPPKPVPVSTGATDTAPKESAGPECALSTNDADLPPDRGASRNGSPSEEKRRSSKKRQKRVKNWAGSILPRKSKSRTQKSSKPRRRSQTPPITRFPKDEDTDCEFSEATDQSSETDVGHGLNRSTETGSRSAKRSQPRAEDEAFYPMIDLDAALGPFNTPTRDPQWEEAQRAGMPPKRQLHSAAGMRGFTGPGMHYHRRAESAPEMPPFEGGRFSMHRFGSSSTMADVFEEDEEDDDHTEESAADDSTSESQDTNPEGDEGHDTDAASTPRQERSAESVIPKIDAPASPSMKTKQSGSSLDLPTHGKPGNQNSPSSLHSEIITENQSYVASTRREAMFATPLDTSGTTSPSRSRDGDLEQKEPTPPDATSIILAAPPTIPISPYSISHSSSFPSPRSPMSYDAHRISTAPSSITDDNNYRSLLMGEPGPELVRLSIDVPPSLASTNSTMTRDSSSVPTVRPRNKPFHEQRPASFTSTAFGRRRSSLASLSRLISSAHGERSKLSMEVPLDNEEGKKSKSSKSKRLTRLMQFWKPKASSDSK